MSTARFSNDIPDTPAIAAALTAAGNYNTNGSDWPAAATALLGALGYRSERIPAGQSGDPGDFIDQYPARNRNTAAERDFREHARSVHILFQFTGGEIRDATQPALLDAVGFDPGNTGSFLFAAVQLRGDTYPRGEYAAFTRELNRHIRLPIVALFRTAGNKVTLGFVQHRPNRRNPERDVLGSVSLIREINPADPHRAHLKILADLSLPERLRWLARNGKPANFDGLLAAWLDALDTEELNKRFYRELYAWFKRALETAEFPPGPARTLGKEEHVIRLITRLMFVWFIKEKGLVAEELFDGPQAEQLLKDYDRARGDSYYRAVLQNLFFATLNTEIQSRRFSRGTNADHRNFSVYRYRKEMAQPDKLAKLFDQTPFINGGLFDCLDSFDSTSAGGVRVDCFTDVPRQRAGYSIPNRLLFGDPANPDVDPGLIDLFHRYKFTVEENTPTEQEVALDPELLGKVFENLLAAVNPETRLTARKETGSYYTPRAVVDYMVDEALVAALAQKTAPADGDVADWQTRLRALLDYAAADAAAETRFTLTERKAIVGAIAGLRVLDPAVGSGAFPMGILHKLTLALRRLDSDNQIWKDLQIKRARRLAADAFDTADQTERGAELQEISETFERYRDSDFGRKLYLIQNSIYGVDVQPIATQIAKLRFFISLTIEQESNEQESNRAPAAADNYGIRPLPNLETKFVAADTLRALEKPVQMPLGQTGEVQRLQRELAANRERYFHANNRAAKLAGRRRGDQLRKEMGEALRNGDFSAAAAEQVAAWDPFDQNADPAGWFDPEYMFGVTDGFDIVIGNPPYVRSEGHGQNPAMRNRIAASGLYETLYEKWDLYIPFIERSYKLLNPGGFTTMIVSDAYCHARYARKSREWFLNNSRVVRLDFFGRIQIFEASVHNIVYLFQKADGQRNKPERRVHYPEFGNVELLPTDEQRNLTERAFFPEDVESSVISVPTIPLQNICYISYGLRPSSKPDAQEKFVTADVTSAIRDSIHCKPFVEGKHLDRWLPTTNLWLEWGTTRAPAQFYAPTFDQLHEVGEKLLVQRSPGPDPKACYDNQQLVFTPSSVGFILWEDLQGIRNRSIQKQARYRDEKGNSVNPMPREQLEQISHRFSIKFLLGVLNSAVARDLLRANRRSNVHLYPDDWKQLPIPRISGARQRPFIRLVERILAAKGSNPAADTSGEEAELDRLVYALYGLTAAEAWAVGG